MQLVHSLYPVGISNVTANRWEHNMMLEFPMIIYLTTTLYRSELMFNLSSKLLSLSSKRLRRLCRACADYVIPYNDDTGCRLTRMKNSC